ncbi:MAG: methylmalonyl Co-A mutase-associated GTPase MeaB [Bacteroidota bacterium]
MINRKKRLTVDEYVDGVRSGDRVILSRAITLIESTLQEDVLLSEQVLQELLPFTGNSYRIGITGVPGVGKSTFIETMGMHVTDLGKKLAVLAIDPSSQRTKGSILGDKTRMERLSHQPNAYIRPSATGNSLGGVANKTRETMLLCEAAGYEVIFIETVGVGQSETAVKGMVDFFLLLMLAGAGDELQGIKKGIMEMADAVAINKADGDNLAASRKAKVAYQNALHLFPLAESGWSPKVLTCSAAESTGIDSIWETMTNYFEYMKNHERLISLRRDQNVHWLHETIGFMLKLGFYQSPEVKDNIVSLENAVSNEEITPQAAARKLISLSQH